MARFLVVDDDSLTVHGLTRLLTEDGHEVVPFMAGAEAVEAIARESFDAVLTDLEMPHIDGHAVVQATRTHLPTACLVVISSRAEDHAEALARAGACIIADKPMDYEGVTNSVHQCRARGGPGVSGRCHMRAPHGTAPTQLRRK